MKLFSSLIVLLALVTCAAPALAADITGSWTGSGSIQFVVSGKPADCPESSCKIGRGSATRKQQ